MTKLDVRTRLEAFMNTVPGSLVLLQENEVNTEFERLCGKSHE
jgi:hypothetical protein